MSQEYWDSVLKITFAKFPALDKREELSAEDNIKLDNQFEGEVERDALDEAKAEQERGLMSMAEETW